MEAQTDFKELLALFNSKGVEYIIVGAYALAHLGAPRATGDLDILVRPSAENAEAVLGALSEFGFGSLGLSITDFTTPEHVIQLGHPPVRIDLLTAISGVTWEQADRNAVAGDYGAEPVRYLGQAEFIANKKACGRPQDLADIEALEGE